MFILDKQAEWVVDCPFVLFHLVIVLSVIFRFMDSDCPFGIFKLLLLPFGVHFKVEYWYSNDHNIEISEDFYEISLCFQ